MYDLHGKTFGHLKVIKRDGSRHGEVQWLCECDCGNTCLALSYALRKQITTHCGCRLGENISKGNTKHGLSNSRIRRIHANMMSRCYNPKVDSYKWYGALGIEVCDDWKGKNGFCRFCEWAFSNGYDKNLSLDRKINSMNYSPSNCRWVTMEYQQNNRTNNRLLTYNGETLTMANWAKKLNISYGKIQSMLSRKMESEVMSELCTMNSGNIC